MQDNKIWIFSDRQSESLTNILINNLFSLGLADDLVFCDYIEDLDSLKELKLMDEKQIIYFVFENREMASFIVEKCRELGIKYFDVYNILFGFLRSMISGISEGKEIGKLVEISKKKFVEFAINNDDGKNPSAIKEADFVIVGISRTTKTPLSIYMSNQGFKVANVPLVPELDIPEELFDIDKNKIIALTMSLERLEAIRKERLKSLGLPKDAVYASLERIKEELNYAEHIIKKLGCHSIDVSYISIEETADVIKNMIHKF